MQDIIATEVAQAKDLHEISTRLQQLFQALRTGGSITRVGVIAGVVAADGPDFCEQNLKRLSTYTQYIRSRHTFPVFSATDIFTNARLDEQSKNVKAYRQFWESFITSGLVTDLFVTPRWEKSQNAQAFHDQAKRLGLKIHYWDIFDVYPVYRS